MIVRLLFPEGDPGVGKAHDRLKAVLDRLAPGTPITRSPVRSGESVRGPRPGSPCVLIDGMELDGLPPEWLLEAAVLRALHPRHVLFLCVANSARSQLAEGIARSLAPAGVTVSSAGSAPTTVRPEAVEVLREIGIDISAHRSKSVKEVNPAEVDGVVTLCADEVCPAFPGRVARIHWGLPDPAAAAGDREARLAAFRSVRDELRRRLSVLFPPRAPGSGGVAGSRPG